MKVSLETVREVWNDEDGEHWEVGPDRDDLGCVEIRFYDQDNKIGERMMFSLEAAAAIGGAILECVNELAKK